jgi:hypothetical protein
MKPREFPKHPELEAQWEKNGRLVYWIATRLSRWLRRRMGVWVSKDELLGYGYEMFNESLWIWEPDRGTLSTILHVRCFSRLADQFLRLESGSWYRWFDRYSVKPEGMHQTDVNFAYHESGFHLYRVPERDQEWAVDILLRFRSPDEAWAYFTKCLDKRSKHVLERHIRFGHTLREIGIDEKVTRERVRQIQERAVAKICRMLLAEGFEDSLPDDAPRIYQRGA